MTAAAVGAAATADRRLWRAYLVAITVYFGLHALVRVLVSPSPELDEAEQLLWSQRLAWGYGTQPPLYTWLQATWFSVTGVSIAGLTTLKNTLLWVIYAATAAAVRRLAGTPAAVVAGASLLWLPTLGWESQRDLTHTVLATACAAVAFWLMVRIVERGLPRDYVALGAVAGLGLLAKYNFAVFLALALMAAIFSRGWRHRLFSRYTLLAMAIAGAVVAPHLVWAVEHWDLVSGGTLAKMTAHDRRSVGERIGVAAQAVLAFATPWWLVFGGLALWRRGKGVQRPQTTELPRPAMQAWILAYGALVVVVLAVMALVGATQIKARWLQPMLFLLPALVIVMLPLDWNAQRWRTYRWVSVGLALLFLALMALRGYHQGGKPRPDEWNLPIPGLAQAIRGAGFQTGVIVVPNAVIAGGLRLQFPHAEVLVAAQPMPDPRGRPQVFVQAEHDGGLMSAWPLATPPQTVRLPYLYARPDTPLFEARFVVLPAVRP